MTIRKGLWMMVIMVQEMLQKHSIFVYISIYMCFTEVIFNSFIHLPQVSQKILLQFDHLNPSFTKRPKDGIPDHSQKRQEVPLKILDRRDKKTHHFERNFGGGRFPSWLWLLKYGWVESTQSRLKQLSLTMSELPRWDEWECPLLWV